MERACPGFLRKGRGLTKEYFANSTLFELRHVIGDIEGLQDTVFAQIEGVVRMAFFRALSGGIPHRAPIGSNADHISDTVWQIVSLFNDSPPGGPDGRSAGPIQREGVIKGLHIFPVKIRVVGTLHIVWIGSPLGIDIEHDKAVIAIIESHALH